MIREFTVDEFVYLLLAARWTLLLSIIALLGGGSVGLLVALARASQHTGPPAPPRRSISASSRARRC